jgi:hypothetical protein
MNILLLPLVAIVLQQPLPEFSELWEKLRPSLVGQYEDDVLKGYTYRKNLTTECR